MASRILHNPQRGWMGDYWPQLSPDSGTDTLAWYGRWLATLASNEESAKGLKTHLQDSPAQVRAVLSAFIARHLSLTRR